ncbi:carboxymuconolactone decarboxylase family protein [Mycobacterium sp. Aquia_213]|uniref:carboxymuconolactone decarboxylase family protein n=1 Tax=Mycobacterium sp. Aquia_213 TaxID=2991728 RepID=UPI00226DB1D1|nr:carboxymuconolactone decarboxylase family protein [Mycobacterium sp. Aquia_213]WAC93861.1 carboxymuconolactone decarboxylase family protein [Mycobacterium sp. Aquia_213]
MRNRFKMCAVAAAAALIISGTPSIAPRSSADGCGDVAPALVPPSGCAGPAPAPQAPSGSPPWVAAVQQRDPQFAASYQGMRERILKDGAIPAKYKLLMGMITDTIAAHPDGVRSLADSARAAGASEAEITEAVEVGYLYGGTAALVMGVNAFPGN